MAHGGTASPEVPVLTATDLVLATDGPYAMPEGMYYGQSGTNIAMPTHLVIETEFRFISGTTDSRAPGRSSVLIHFITAPYVAGLLGVERDTVFLSHDFNDRGRSVTVDTDDSFHLYRIEVLDTRSAGGEIRVYQDGVLILTDALLGTGGNAAPYGTPQIWFGDGTDWAYGESRWRSFRHNAARSASRPVMSIRSAPDEVCWSSCPGVLYTVHCSSQLSTPTWMPLFTNVVGSGDITCVADPLPRREAQRFYRVEVQR
jgi:hypothetical protein